MEAVDIVSIGILLSLANRLPLEAVDIVIVSCKQASFGGC